MNIVLYGEPQDLDDDWNFRLKLRMVCPKKFKRQLIEALNKDDYDGFSIETESGTIEVAVSFG